MVLTNQNLLAAQGEIKAIASECTGTPTAKLIAVLNAAGITKASDVAAILGISERAVRKAKAEPQFRNYRTGGTVVPELQDRAELQDRNHSSENGTTVPKSVLARVLDNNKLTNLEDSSEKKDSKKPLPLTKTKLPTTNGPTPTDALVAFEAYNATALACGLPQASKLTPDRQRKIMARLRDYGLEGWNQALANIDRSSFLTGQNDRGWRASLDFLIQPASFAKVHDGGYGNGRHLARSGHVAPDKPQSRAWKFVNARIANTEGRA